MSILRPLLLSIITLFSVSAAQAATYFFHTDHLGTPQVLSDKDQNVVWQGEYSPFGDVTETTRAVEQNLRFPGQYFDNETGLYYNYFRDYDPSIGRYVQSDPIGIIGNTQSATTDIESMLTAFKQGGKSLFMGLNHLYTYTANNPIIYSDPTGESLSSVLITAGLTGLIVYVTVDCINKCGKNKKNQCPPTPPMKIASDCVNQCIPFLNFLGLNSINSIMLNVSKRLGAKAGGG